MFVARRFVLLARRAFTAAALALPLLSSAAALAEDSPTPQEDAAPELAEARDKFRAGADAYAAGHYKESIVLFLAANRLQPSPALSYNVARAYEKLGDPARALSFYRDYLRRARSPADQAGVQALIGALSRRLEARGVQQVTILSSVRGATVLVDEQPIGVAPLTLELTPGMHRVALRLRGYQDVEQEFRLSPDIARDVTVQLVPNEPDTTATTTQDAEASDVEATSRRATPVEAPDAGSDDGTRVEPRADRGKQRLRTWGFVSIGVGVAAMGGALAFEALRKSSENDAEHAPTQRAFVSSYDTMESRKNTARVLLGTGAAFAVTGGTLLFFGYKPARTDPGTAWGLGCDGHGCNASVRGKF
jgi:tetratricopeptide (TPR) repeat protein